MRYRSRSVKAAAAPLLLLAGLAALLIFEMQPAATQLERNLLGIRLATQQRATGPVWDDMTWWHTICQGDAASLTGPDAAVLPDSDHLIAWEQMMQGACDDAIATLLDADTPHPLTHLWLAHLYGATGNWDSALDHLRALDATPNDWQARRYWANVAYRAALDTTPSEFDAASGFALSDAWAFPFALSGSTALAEYLRAQGKPTEAFQELRHALSFLEDDDAWQLFGQYQELGREFVQAELAKRPDDPELQRIGQRYATGATTPAASVTPTERLELAQPLNYRWNDEGTLAGLEIDWEAAALGPFVEASLLWEHRPASSDPIWYLQRRIVRNMAPDAGFEWGPARSGVRPLGYEAVTDNAVPYPWAIVERDGVRSLCFDNRGGALPALLRTPFLSLQPGANRLLQSIRYRTDATGLAVAGVRWLGDSRTASGNSYISSLRNETSPQWSEVAAVLELPDNASPATTHITQSSDPGEVCFGGLVTFLLEGPPAIPTQ